MRLPPRQNRDRTQQRSESRNSGSGSSSNGGRLESDQRHSPEEANRGISSEFIEEDRRARESLYGAAQTHSSTDSLELAMAISASLSHNTGSSQQYNQTASAGPSSASGSSSSLQSDMSTRAFSSSQTSSGSSSPELTGVQNAQKRSLSVGRKLKGIVTPAFRKKTLEAHRRTLGQWVENGPFEERTQRSELMRYIMYHIDLRDPANLRVANDFRPPPSQTSLITELPPGLLIEDNAHLCMQSLKQLPSDFFVGRTLQLTNCKSLTSFGNTTSVGGNLYIVNCPALTSMPSYVTTWGRANTPDVTNGIRTISLSDTGMSAASYKTFLAQVREHSPGAIRVEAGWDRVLGSQNALDDSSHFNLSEAREQAGAELRAGKYLQSDPVPGKGQDISRDDIVRHFEIDEGHPSAPKDVKRLRQAVFRTKESGEKYRFVVTEKFSAADFPSINALPFSTYYAKDLTLTGSKVSAISGFIRGSLFADDSKLTYVGDDVAVGQHVSLRGCTELRALPDSWLRAGQTIFNEMRLLDLRDTGIRKEFLAYLVYFGAPGCELRISDTLPENFFERSLTMPTSVSLDRFNDASIVRSSFLSSRENHSNLASLLQEIELNVGQLREQRASAARRQATARAVAQVARAARAAEEAEQARRAQIAREVAAEQEAQQSRQEMESARAARAARDEAAELAAARAALFGNEVARATRQESETRRSSSALDRLAASLTDPEVSLEGLSMSRNESSDLHIFLNRLRDTAEWRSSAGQQNVRRRMSAMLSLAKQDEGTRSLLFGLVNAGITSCEDRIAHTLDEFDLAISVDKASRSADPEASLRQLGVGMMMTEALQRLAMQFYRRDPFRFNDQIELMLGLYVSLQQEFSLPAKSQSMRFSSHLTQEHLQEARLMLRRINADRASQERWLQEFPPYVKARREKEGGNLDPALLPPRRVQNSVDDPLVCPITQEPLENLIAPVGWVIGNTVYVAEAEDFKKYWAMTGHEPVTRTPIELSALFRPVG